MKIQSIYDQAFLEYGRIVEGIEFADLLQRLTETTEASADGVVYTASDADLESMEQYRLLSEHCYGGMPIQIGWCNGANTKLNCLEYHKDAEINIAAEDMILLLAKLKDVKDWKIDTAKVEAFLCPKGKAVELYMTSLHYAPCCAAAGKPFRVIVVLPKGTNLDKPDSPILNEEDRLLFARNKWLLAHPDAQEAEKGAFIGLTGENIDLLDSI